MEIGGIILSGGKSSRMGTNKALLKIDQKTNIERVRDVLKMLCSDIILVSNEPEAYQFLHLKTVKDKFPGQGPLAGIHAGLIASSSEVNIVVACDMPFVSSKLAERLVQFSDGYDAVIPIIDGRKQPLFALYKKGIEKEIERCMKRNQLRMMQLLDNLNVFYLTEEDLPSFSSDHLEQIFFNMNQPEEYEQAKNWPKRENNNLSSSEINGDL
jgi:molybdenum cofactor guanylyltransferase